MNYHRGDLVTVAAGGGFGGKPRPALVIQSDIFEPLPTICVLLFSSEEDEHPLLQLAIAPSEKTGLRVTSRLMIHAPTTIRRKDVGQRIGQIADAEMIKVERALLIFLGFAE